MITRSYKALTSRPIFVLAAVLAILMLAAPFVFAETSKLSYAENGTDSVATFSAMDEDGDPIEWTLTGDDAGKFVITPSADGASAELTFKDDPPNYEDPADANKDNEYLVTVNASETSDPLDLEITVTDEDEDGKVSFEGRGRFQPQVGRTLSATLSDPDADVEDERWQWARGPSADGPWTEIDKATSASRSPVDDDLNMYLRATVTYDDKFGADKTASAVTENAVEDRTRANAAPSFEDQDETGPDEDDDTTTEGLQDITIVNRDVDEGVKGANVGKPVSATDANNDVLHYTISANGTMINGRGGTSTAVTNIKTRFSIDPRSGQLKTKEKLNSDDSGLVGVSADGLADNDDNNGEATYTVTVTATDPSGASTPQMVTVTVNDVNDAPKFAEYVAGTQDRNATTLYVVENAQFLSNDKDDAEAAVADPPVTVPADNAPNYTATDADAFDAGLGDTASAADSTTGAPANVALKYEVTGPDKDAFVSPVTMDGTAGVVTLAFKSDHKVNYEKQDEYEITIVASDDSAPEGTAMVDVTVTVVNAEDGGEVIPTQREPQVGKEVAVRLEDDDGKIHGQKWQWYRNVDSTDTEDDQETALAGAPACTLITPAGTVCSIPRAESPNYTPVHPADTGTRLAARVTYTDAFVTLNTATPRADAGDMMHVVMQADVERENAANTAPKFSDDQDPNTPGDQADAARSVPENEKDANVGEPVTANDPGDLLIYSLSGADASSFTVDSGLKKGDSAGQITTAMKLDYETKAMYMVVVTATDPSGATDNIMVNIEVTDVDDKTVVSIVAMMNGKIDYAEGGTDPVAMLSAMDQDGDPIEWTKTGDDAGKFAITASADGASAELTFKDDPPNYEAPGDANKNNVYLVTVNASETSDPLDLEITVTDEDEDGKVSFEGRGRFQPQVGRTLSATLDDPDADVEDERWQWSRGPSMDGPWTEIDKATSASRSPVDDDLNMYLRATVTYDDKFGTDKTAPAVTENAVEDRTRANAAPSFEDQDETGPDEDDDTTTEGLQDITIVNRDVDEGVKGANVGKPVSATDANNDVLHYTISANGTMINGRGGASTAVTNIKTRFSIDPRSGQLKTKEKLNSDDSGLVGVSNDNLADNDDNNGEATYTVTVTATDPSGASTPQMVTVTVNDVNDAPKFAEYVAGTQDRNATTLYVVENAQFLSNDKDDAEAAVADPPVTVPADNAPNYTATDADAFDAGLGDTASAADSTTGAPANVALKYEVTGPDKDAFVSPVTMDGTAGVVTLAFKSDHKVNYEKQDEYEITIVASDDSAPEGTAMVDVTVTVVNAEDGGEVIPTQREPQVGKEVAVRLEDDDGKIHGQKWQWYRNVDSTDTEDDQETALAGAPACTLITPAGTVCSIPRAESPNYTPVHPADTGTRLAARVTYTDAFVTLNTATPRADAGDMMHVVMQADVERENAANTAPKFSDDQDPNTPGDQADAARSVPENEKDANVGEPVTANDPGDLLIYSLSGADASIVHG